MGSTLSSTQFFLLASASGALFLIFDAARYFLSQISPMRLRSVYPQEEQSKSWFQYSAHSFSLVTGALLQITLISAVGFTAGGLAERGPVTAALLAVFAWSVIAIGWKFVLALVPEDFAIHALKTLIPLSYVFYYLFWPALFPLRLLMQKINERREEDVAEDEVSEEEVQAYIDVGEEVGIFEEGEGKMIQSIVDFGDKIAKELMTPRVDVLAFDASKSLDDLAASFSDSKYSRIPIYDESIDRILGIVHIKDLFDAVLKRSGATPRQIARPPLFVPETKHVSELLRDFQIEHIQIAVVVDEFGGTAGVITIEDVIEEIVGEIADEHEDESENSIVELENDVWLVSGVTRVESVEEVVGAGIAGDDYETIAGMIFTQLGHVPKVGETLEKNGLRFEIERADRKRIYRVRISRPDAGRNERDDE